MGRCGFAEADAWEEMDLAQSSQATDGMDSVPALLQRNATRFAGKAAYREKEFGIWQSWSWAEAEKEIEALALGLLGLGVDTGDFIAIIGRNRPHFYWAMVAAQSVGAIPVPLYQDAAAEEMAYVMDHCGARFAIVEDQEQVDKLIEVQEDLHQLEHMIYVDPRGCGNTTTPSCTAHRHPGTGARGALRIHRRVEGAARDGWITTASA